MKKSILFLGLLIVSVNLIGWWLFLGKIETKFEEPHHAVAPARVLVSSTSEKPSASQDESLREADPELVEYAEMGRRVIAQLSRYMPATKADGTELNPPMARMLGLDENQVERVNKIFSEGITKVKDLEKENSRVETMPNGDERIVIEPFRNDGRAVMEAIIKDLGVAMSKVQLEAIAPNIRNGRSGFGKIGESRTEVAILEIREGGEDDGVFLEIKRFAEDGRSLGGSMSSIDSAGGKLRRYDHLFNRSNMRP